MPRLSSPRLLLTAWLALAGSPLLAATTPQAVAQRAAGPAQTVMASPSSLSQLWHHLTTLWAAIGCGLDPNGVKCASSGAPPAAVTATTPADIGCGIDPNGCTSTR